MTAHHAVFAGFSIASPERFCWTLASRRRGELSNPPFTMVELGWFQSMGTVKLPTEMRPSTAVFILSLNAECDFRT
jgi:hypothetical protein